jgi:drug/metabolite transporter (DMT)-like permease
MQEKTRGTVEMTAAMLISGTIGWVVVASGEPVLNVVFWRCVFGAATLLVICAALGFLRRGVITPRQLGIAALGGVAIVANWLLLFASYSHASISIATAVYNTQPFMLVALGAMFMRERITATKLFWLGVAFLGMVMIVQAKPNAAYVGTDYLSGIVLALGAAAGYAVAAILTKKLKGVPPHLIALIHVGVGIIMLLPFGGLSVLPSGAGAWAALGTAGVVHTGVMYILLYAAIQRLPTNVIGALSFIYPIVAILVDYFAFGHRLHVVQLVGAAAILVSAAGMTLGWTLRSTIRSVPAVTEHSHGRASRSR